MNLYTKEQLASQNPIYAHRHGITERDLTRVNMYKAMIEATRKDALPSVGDIVEHTTKNGVYHPNAHIEKVSDDGMRVCENPFKPFVSLLSIDSVSTVTSGGSWADLPIGLPMVGKRNKIFSIWGHGGPQADGSIDFHAEVNVYRYNESNLPVTTETHNIYLATFRKEGDSEKVPFATLNQITDSFPSARLYFQTEQDYNLFMATFGGESQQVGTSRVQYVFTYKQFETCISFPQYKEMVGAFIDTDLKNGTVQECKRVQHGSTMTTFYPYQSDKIATPGEKPYRAARSKVGLFA